MKANLKQSFFFLILSFWSFPSIAQTPLIYQGHKMLTSLNTSDGYFERFVINRSLESDKLVSAFITQVNYPTAFDLSLNEAQEIYSTGAPFQDNSFTYTVYRSHFGEDLETDFSVEFFHRGSGSAFNYSDSQVAFDIDIADSTGVAISSGETYTHNSNTFRRNIRTLIDMDFSEIYRRDILYKPGGANFVMSLNGFGNNQGLVNADVQINDFTFTDSLYVIQNADTVFRYSDDWVLYLEVSDATNIIWSGDLDYTGTLRLQQSTLSGLNSFRLFTISGEVDFDPTPATSAYETPSNETHLVLVKYSQTGNVLWTKTLAKFLEWVDNPGSFKVNMNKDVEERMQLYFNYEGNLANDSTGVLSVMIGNDVIDSGVMTPIQTSRNSPYYIFSINSETGSVIKVFNVYNDSSDGGYTTRESAEITIQEEGKVAVSLRNFHYLTTPFVLQKLYPDFQEFTLQNSPPEDFNAYQFITLSTIDGNDDFEQYNLYYTSGSNAFVTLRHIPLDGENMMFAGEILKSSDVYIGSTLLNLENNPDPDFGQDGLVIFADGNSVSTNDLNPNKLSFDVYPNPTSEFVQVKFDSDVPVDYHLFNAMGVCIQSGSITSYNQIDMRSFSNGLYVLQILKDNRVQESIKIEKL